MQTRPLGTGKSSCSSGAATSRSARAIQSTPSAGPTSSTRSSTCSPHGPTPPVLVASEDEWVIQADEGTHHVAFVGGTPSSKALLHFSEPPYRLISWDGWGRATWTEVPSEE